MNLTRQMQEQSLEAGRNTLKEFDRETAAAFQVNCDLLMKILHDNADTEYGRKYDFASIHSVEEYQKRVPVIVYDDIAEQIERMAEGEKNILTAYSFNHLNSTSGTVGAMKLVPMTKEQTDVFFKYDYLLNIGVKDKYLSPDWINGRAFGTSEGTHSTLPSGVTVGSASSVMADCMHGGMETYDSQMRVLFTSPTEASIPSHGDDTKYIHSRFALMDGDITGIITGLFSQVVLYMNYITDNCEMLIDDIEHGTISESVELLPETRESLMKKISPMPERAAQLRSIFSQGTDFQWMPKVWPKLLYIRGVGADGFVIYDRIIKERYAGNGITCFYSGLSASEVLTSACVEPNSPSSAVIPSSAFFEFLPVDAGDDFSQIVTLDKVEVGRLYETIVTNLCGFYRYRTRDAVRITGFYNKTPMLEFMYRTNRTINMMGEKVTEKDLQWVVENTCDELGLSLADFSVYADQQTVPGQYVFLVELFRQPADLDRVLFAEVLQKYMAEASYIYGYEVKTGNIASLKVLFLQPETNFLYRDMMVMRGSSPSQLKPVRIIMNERQRRFFFRLVEDNE